MTVTADQLVDSLAYVARDGAARAGRALSGLLGQGISIHVPAVRIGTRADACDAVGGAESVVFGAYLGISGDVTGHVMLLFPVERALACVDLMCGRPAGTSKAMDALAESAVGELGNILGPASVNALADELNVVLHPSPPAILHDMAIALVQSVYAEVMSQGGDVVMMDTVFEDSRGQIAGLLIVAPDPAGLAQLLVPAA
jgi:chemotaxis protein CheC